jgi:hypothetical protein
MHNSTFGCLFLCLDLTLHHCNLCFYSVHLRCSLDVRIQLRLFERNSDHRAPCQHKRRGFNASSLQENPVRPFVVKRAETSGLIRGVMRDAGSRMGVEWHL